LSWLQRKGLHYVDVGVSGGVWGLERGYCQMIGGETSIDAFVGLRYKRWKHKAPEALAEVVQSFGRQHGRYSVAGRSAWPPNSMRSADSSLSEYSASPREPRREKSAVAITGAGTPHATAANVLPRDGGDGGLILGEFEKAGINIGALGEKLQVEGAETFVQSWRELLQAIDAKSTTLRRHADATAKGNP
jgi:hypothetical protein